MTEQEIEVINMAANTAVNILNMTDDDSIKSMAAHIADILIGLTDVPDL